MKFSLSSLALAALMLPQAQALDVAPRRQPPLETPRRVRPGALIILDPGHGGGDLGAVVKGEREKDVVLAVARRLKARLENEQDFPVRLTRDSDAFLPLDARVGESEDLGGAVFVSLHADKVRSRKQSGMTVYAFGASAKKWTVPRRRRKLPPLPAPPRELAKASAALASLMVRDLRSAGLHAEPPARARYYVLKNPEIPSVLVELGFLSNPEEAARLNDPDYQDKVAGALARSLADYLSRVRSGRGIGAVASNGLLHPKR